MLKNKESRIIFICWLVYAAAYTGRINFSASNVAVIEAFSASKSEVGLVSSFFFFAYGAGQLINGILSKKYNARVMIFISLTASSVLNVLMPFCPDVSVMKFIWLFNGLAQSILWSTLIKVLSTHVSDKRLPKAIFAMSTTVPTGTFIAYGLSALFVKLGIWQTVFFSSAVIMSVAAVIWLRLSEKSEKSQPVIPEIKEKQKTSKAILLPLILAAFAGVANGFIKDGINTWVPSVLYESFGLSKSFSILLTLILPLVSTLGATGAKKTHEKVRSHSAMNFLFFSAASVAFAAILVSFRFHSLAAIMIFFVAVACIMAMSNNVITSMFALDNRAVINAGFAAGLLNTFCYTGSTITTYSLGAVSQTKGWNAVFMIMFAVCIIASAVCLFGFAAEKRIKKGELNEKS